MEVSQHSIIRDLYAEKAIHPEDEIRKRINFLKDYLLQTGAKGYVLGISGGQDSTLAGKLAQLAVDELNKEKNETYNFIGVRLPYGKQFDEEDAMTAMNFIAPSIALTVDIQPAVDQAAQAIEKATGRKLNDFQKGNTKARERMKVQYDLGAMYQCLVIGTNIASEELTGFYTKYGDGACDIAPLYGLNKRQGKQMLQVLQAPQALYEKVPTADLESDHPGLPDEEALGVTYDEIDDFLEGRKVDASIEAKLIQLYKQTAHKRKLPTTIYDQWWK
ncbi:ammonia-dependent NAD(+) synthetase [Aliibacillus thermotolerans]|uniref:NH(3)-dependent NAD(+) synthetase n=1 Tax=Aliibacillus thermotolerans TaxID=1834418 RepID=A0ABW0U5Z4_9BACI|nr:ammonia-dependent NAD(+) synthetase [Aliibacillus thermotolerans]MDA3130064.1 ammonia-dependent NAD(+) synthetase [Aliibacillus thermotolerans]